MGVVPNVKCRGCDRSYSRLRNKCPYCGARRSKGGKRAASAPDPTARLIVGGLILLAIVITFSAGIWMTLRDRDDDPVDSVSPSPEVEDNAGADDPDATATPVVTPTPTPALETVTSVDITWPYKLSANEMTISVGDQVEIECEMYPTDAVATITWGTDAQSVCTVTPDTSDSHIATITAQGSGTATITVSAGGQEAELKVIVR